MEGRVGPIEVLHALLVGQTSLQNMKRKKHEEESVRIRPENSEVELLVASAKKLNQLTNWSPKVPLKEGLKITIEWWQEKINSKSFLASGDYKF